MIDLWCSKMVRSKIRLTLTVLIILTLCAGLIISTADAMTGSTSGKSAGRTGKAASTGTTGFNTAALGKTSISSTNTFGVNMANNAFTASDNVFGTATNNLVAGQPGAFINTFSQSFSPGVTAFGNPMAAATNTRGSSVFGNAVAHGDNVLGTTFSQVDANRQAPFITSFDQSFVPGVTDFGQVQVAAGRTGSFQNADAQSIV
jgi:hypothetical protein